MKLIGTPLSHFTRKVRILCAELAIAYDQVWAPGVLGTEAARYGDNPLLRIPTLIDGDTTVFDSEHIARYLVRRFDPADRLGVTSDDVAQLNWLAVVNGLMHNEVVLVLAARGGLTGLDDIVYFRKIKTALDNGLAWLDARAEPDADRFDYRDIATVCLWQHLAHYQLVPDLARHARLAARVARLGARPSVATTAPQASLDRARADGWQPA